MATPTDSNWQDALAGLQAQVTKQGSAVRQLKKDGAEADLIAEAVQALTKLKISCSTLEAAHVSSEGAFDRKAFDDLVLRKMFVIPSFEIHGGVKGLFDLGPPACALKVRD
jgi:glycyl-tRNA synthetase